MHYLPEESPMNEQLEQRIPWDRLTPAIEHLVEDYLTERRREHRWKMIVRAAIVAFVLGSVGLYWSTYGSVIGLPSVHAAPGVAVVDVSGQIGGKGVSTADRLVPLVTRACGAPTTRALVLRINSGGGSPADAERIAAAVLACRERRPELPVWSSIEGVGASAAYLVAASAGTVTASRYGMVGSIGAVMRTLDASVLAARAGIGERTYASGPLKASGSLVTEPTAEQAAHADELVGAVAAAFRAQVMELREGRLDAVADRLVTGRMWIGEEALALGLVDEVVTLEQRVAREHPGLALQWYRPARTIQEQITAEAVVGALVDRVMASASEPGRFE